jgi:hypothetical protein
LDASGYDTSVTCVGGCGGQCAPGCALTTTCQDGVMVCECTCPPQPEASTVDVGQPDAPETCFPDKNQCPYYVPFACLDGSVPDAGLSNAQCAPLCGFPPNGAGFCNLGTDPAGQPAVECFAQCGIGRRTTRRSPKVRPGGVVGRYLCAAARLEADSVHAFRRLRRELEEHGAPARLRRAALRAERDEVRHARDTGELARAHGVTPRMPRERRRPRRSLEAIAVENAVEGCVRETYGALVAMFQAEAAKDTAVARHMRRVAADEVRHATLSWQVAGWVAGKLGPRARARVESARRTAAMELLAEIGHEPPAVLVDTVGLPDAAAARRLLTTMLAGLDARSTMLASGS